MEKLGRIAPRECEGVSCSDVIARSEATKQSIFFFGAAMDCFASLAMTALGLNAAAYWMPAFAGMTEAALCHPHRLGAVPPAPRFFAPALFPLATKTLYGAARLCRGQSRIINQDKGLAGVLGLWRAV